MRWRDGGGFDRLGGGEGEGRGGEGIRGFCHAVMFRSSDVMGGFSTRGLDGVVFGSACMAATVLVEARNFLSLRYMNDELTVEHGHDWVTLASCTGDPVLFRVGRGMQRDGDTVMIPEQSGLGLRSSRGADVETCTGRKTIGLSFLPQPSYSLSLSMTR